jgi:hypothetical protein
MNARNLVVTAVAVLATAVTAGCAAGPGPNPCSTALSPRC